MGLPKGNMEKDRGKGDEVTWDTITDSSGALLLVPYVPLGARKGLNE